MSERGETLMNKIFLAGIICVVDASNFEEIYNSTSLKPSLEAESPSPEENMRPLSELYVNQLESADIVVTNKMDLIDEPKKRTDLLQLIRYLNSRAKFFEATQGDVPLKCLLPAGPVSIKMPAYVPSFQNRHKAAVESADASNTAHGESSHGEAHGDVDGRGSGDSHGHGGGHGHGHRGGHGHGYGHEPGGSCDHCDDVPPSHARFGIGSFVYQRPVSLFDPEKLSLLMKSLPVEFADLTPLQHENPAVVSSAVGGNFEL